MITLDEVIDSIPNARELLEIGRETRLKQERVLALGEWAEKHAATIRSLLHSGCSIESCAALDEMPK